MIFFAVCVIINKQRPYRFPLNKYCLSIERNETAMKQFSVILIGAGDRGTTYIKHMKNMPEKFKIVAVAEPIEARRNFVKDLFDLSDSMCFADWKDILDRPKLADIAIIATMDEMHYEPAMKAIELGYDLLLEKPAAQEEGRIRARLPS